MPGFPDHHQLPEFTQTHDPVGDAIQPSHPLSSPSPPAFTFPSIRVFSNESVFHIRGPKHWSFSFSISPSSEYSGLLSFSMGSEAGPMQKEFHRKLKGVRTGLGIEILPNLFPSLPPFLPPSSTFSGSDSPHGNREEYLLL